LDHRAIRDRGRLIAVTERPVNDQVTRPETAVGGSLPDLVELALPNPLIGRGRPALARVSAQDQGAVGEHALLAGVEDQLIGVRPGSLRALGTVEPRHHPAPQLRCPFRVELAQEVPDPVGLVLGHQGRSLALELVPDLG